MQAVLFSGPEGTFDRAGWKTALEKFGDIYLISVTGSAGSGYAMFHERRAALAAAEAFHNGVFEGNNVTLELCDAEEMQMAFQLSDPRLSCVELSEPATAGNVFSITETQPPLFWRSSAPSSV